MSACPSETAGDASGVLMNTHNRGVDHLDRSIMRGSQGVHDPAPHASPTPANEAVVASAIGAELLRQIAPRCTRSQHPKDAIQHTAVVHTWDTARRAPSQSILHDEMVDGHGPRLRRLPIP